MWISEQTAIISLYSINWLVFITEAESVYSAVRTGSLNKIQFRPKWVKHKKGQFWILFLTGCQIWAFTIRENIEMVQNGAPRRKFGHKTKKGQKVA